MNKQDIFNKVVTHLRRQGVCASILYEDEHHPPHRACVYLDKATGRRCAIGALIPDNHPALTDPRNVNWAILNLLRAYPDLKDLWGVDVYFLAALQRAHDTGNSFSDPRGVWENHFQDIALIYGLTMPCDHDVNVGERVCFRCHETLTYRDATMILLRKDGKTQGEIDAILPLSNG